MKQVVLKVLFSLFVLFISIFVFYKLSSFVYDYLNTIEFFKLNYKLTDNISLGIFYIGVFSPLLVLFMYKKSRIFFSASIYILLTIVFLFNPLSMIFLACALLKYCV
jgi:hypothetical protein